MKQESVRFNTTLKKLFRGGDSWFPKIRRVYVQDISRQSSGRNSELWSFFKDTVDYVNSASTSTYDLDEFLPFQTLTEATYKPTGRNERKKKEPPPPPHPQGDGLPHLSGRCNIPGLEVIK
jgi:hypothetical protein